VVHVLQATVVDREWGLAAHALVDAAVADLTRRGVEATDECVDHHGVAVGVAGAAARFCADLVVVGCRRPDDLGGLLLAGVAHRVVQMLRCPVLLARTSRAASSACERRGGRAHATDPSRAVVLLRRA
jgi:nucleotide-binding universal stress UspA family protein